MKCGLDCSLLG